MRSGLTGAVLAGGDSRRMGRDKAELPYAGQPLLHHVCAVLADVADEILIVTRPERRDRVVDLAPAGCRIVTDALPGHGPLVGLHAALQAAAHDRVLLVGCDMPHLKPTLLRAMAESAEATGADVVIARLAGGYEPLHAVYRRRCLAAIERVLADGPAPVPAFFTAVQVATWPEERVKAFDPALSSFDNINAPGDLSARP